jgi:hypothetical protein
VASESILQRRDAECRFHRDRQPPPITRQLVLSDRDLLDATDEDFEKWDRLLRSAPGN